MVRIARVASFTLALSVCLLSQTPAESPPTKPADARSTPRGAVFGFLEAARDGEYNRAASYLDLRGAKREREPAELAREFKRILDRKLMTDPGLLSNIPEGDLTDGLDPKFELLGTVQLDGSRVDLMLERVPVEEGVEAWMVSSGTVNMIPPLYEDLNVSPIESWLPAWLLVRGPVDTALWQWLALLLLAIVAFALAMLFASLVLRLIRPIVRRTPSEFDDQLISSIVNPVRFLLTLAVFRAGLVWIGLPVLLRTYVGRLLTALAYLVAAWLVIRIIDIVAVKLVTSMTGRQRASASSVVPLLRRTAKVAAVIIAILATLASWGYDTTALLAGLGVGGLAVALAAQKTIENLFGGVAITTDKPVLIGDFCRFGDRVGTIEDIGLRSTRIRTLDRTVITIPNGQFSGFEIENFARRDKIWFHPILRLRLDTTPDQVRVLIGAFREILLNHPKVDPSPARVRFIGIGDYSINLEIFAYVLTTDYDEFLVVQEELLLSILDAVEQAGTALAVPAQMNLLGRDPLQISRKEQRSMMQRPTDGVS